MSEEGKRQKVKREHARIWRGEIPIKSLYTVGIAGEIFFRALKERGELIGTRCPACEQVYVPARRFCERCFAELTEQVRVGPQGILKSFTFCFVDHDGRLLERPLALALVHLEGATTLFLHRLLGASDPSRVRIGSRARVVLKPKAKRTGSILDIEGFRLVRESDQ